MRFSSMKLNTRMSARMKRSTMSQAASGETLRFADCKMTAMGGPLNWPAEAGLV